MRDAFSYVGELFGPASVIYALRNVRKRAHNNTRLKFWRIYFARIFHSSQRDK